MRKTDVVVLDKTGTLTEGHPTATDGCGHSRRKNTSKMYFAAELKSEHPLGAIVARRRGKITPASSFESITGTKVKGVLSR